MLLLANVVFVNRGIVVVLYQIDGVDVLVKDAGVNELLDVRVQEKFDAGSAGGTQLSRNGHQHRFLAGLSELAGKVHPASICAFAKNDAGNFLQPSRPPLPTKWKK